MLYARRDRGGSIRGWGKPERVSPRVGNKIMESNIMRSGIVGATI
jgi:hypothetical protein